MENVSESEIWYQFRNQLSSGHFDEAQTLLDKNPQLLFETNGIGETVLHFLAVENNLKAVSWLHERGANINTQNEFGAPPLFEIALLKYRELVLWFLKNGADLKLRDNENQTVFEYLSDYGYDSEADFINENL